MAEEQGADPVDDMLEGVDVAHGAQPAGSERHGQEDPGEQKQRDGKAVEDGGQCVFGAEGEGGGVGRGRERGAEGGDNEQPGHQIAEGDAESEEQSGADEERGLHEEDQNVSSDASEKEGEAGRRRDPHALDDAGPHLGEQSEADGGGAEDLELNEQARHEDAPGVGGGKPRGRGDAFEQWPEQGHSGRASAARGNSVRWSSSRRPRTWSQRFARAWGSSPVVGSSRKSALEQLAGASGGVLWEEPVHPCVVDELLAHKRFRLRGAALGDVADRAPDRDWVSEQVVPGDGGGAARGRRQGSEHPLRGRLPRPVKTEEPHDLAAVHVEIDAAHGVHIATPSPKAA